MAGLTLVEYSDELAADFRDINTAWIAAEYVLEPTDIDVLAHPRARIVDPGGVILFAALEGHGIVGAGALRREAEGVYELTKMGVRAAARGHGAGAFLLEQLIARAVAMPARTLFLLTNARAHAAIHLYEKAGFAHDAEIMARYGAHYARCDVAMRYPIAATRVR